MSHHTMNLHIMSHHTTLQVRKTLANMTPHKSRARMKPKLRLLITALRNHKSVKHLLTRAPRNLRKRLAKRTHQRSLSPPKIKAITAQNLLTNHSMRRANMTLARRSHQLVIQVRKILTRADNRSDLKLARASRVSEMRRPNPVEAGLARVDNNY